MRIGTFIATDQPTGTLDNLVAEVRQAEQAGLASVWIYNIFGFDAMTVAAVCGAVTSRIELVAAVMPIQTRHPFAMAQQALSTQAAVGGRFTLGLGVSHRPWVEGVFGLLFARPYTELREYLAVLTPLLRTGRSDYESHGQPVQVELSVPGAPPCPLLLAALGPRMLALAGWESEGTITWATGPKTLSGHIIPRLGEAAAAAGRPMPRVAAGFPIAVATDLAEARATADRLFAIFATLHSYRAMLDREGVTGLGDLTICGDEDAVGDQIRRLGEIGVTDFVAFPFPVGPDVPASLASTRALLAKLAQPPDR